MNNRTWLAIALCCLVWFTYMRWFAPPPPPPVATQPATQGTATPSPGAQPALTQGSGVAASGSVPTSPFATVPKLTESETLPDPVRELVFSDVGGKLATIRLPGFHQTLEKNSPLVETLSAGRMPQALGSFFTDPKYAELAYGTYARKSSGTTVVYTHTVDGVTLKKITTPDQGNYYLGAEWRIQLPATAERRDHGYLIIPLGGKDLKYHAEHPLESWEAVTYQNDSITRKTYESIKPGSEVLQGTTKWIAFGNRYFSTAVVNESAINPDVVFEQTGDFTGVYLRYPLISKPGESEVVLRLKIFSGPKEYSQLALVPGLRRLIDYGIFSFLAYPLLELLQFFNRFVHNYGLAIILLTVLVRLLFYPLSLKSYRSMKGMQKLQPQLTALKEKYKDDAQRFAQEQMALFRTHKVNPAGGCLPILVQLPVFIALYAVLQNSIELFHAPFFGWVQDLSAKDPFYIFPALMGLSMFVQQKMTPAVGMDPMQQKILLLMPVVFTFVMLNLPSGLTMYIFVSTLLGILQQVMMNRERAKEGLVPAADPQGK